MYKLKQEVNHAIKKIKFERDHVQLRKEQLDFLQTRH